MRHLTTFFVFSLTLFSASTAFADVGVLDKYDCHNQAQTGKYHCHGDVDKAKLGGFILSGDTRIQSWSTDAGLYLFAGLAANAEYNYRWFAVTGSYYFMPLVTNSDDNYNVDSSVYQQGWEAGFKVGPGVGRLGSKVYLLGGWSSAQLTDTEDSANDGTISGYYVGAGFGANTTTLTFDVAATYRDSSSVEEYFADTLSKNYDVLSLDIRAALGWRF